MGRDIRVESKHLRYEGGKTSDLLTAFELFFLKFPKPCIDDKFWKLSRKDMKEVLNFAKDSVATNSQCYKNGDELIEQLNNIYIRMMPNDVVDVLIW